MLKFKGEMVCQNFFPLTTRMSLCGVESVESAQPDQGKLESTPISSSKHSLLGARM